MAYQFSPSKIRSKQPSPEKRCLPYIATILVPKRAVSATEAGSPTKKLKGSLGEEPFLDVRFQSKSGSEDSEKGLAQSKKIELPYSLVEAGRATSPPKGDFSDLLRIFPTTFAAELFPPFLLIRVRKLPPKPWPLRVGGLPVQFTTDDETETFDRGRIGRGPKVLTELDLHRAIDYNEDILRQAVRTFRELKIKIRDIFWFGGFWQITIPDGTEIKHLPTRVASSPAFYRTRSEAPYPDPAALRSKPPQGVEYDDTVYMTALNRLLRPGIMLSSSIRTIVKNGRKEDSFKTTTSGILVANKQGQIFITVATHGFEDDGLVYHPNPHKGTVIGRIIESLPDTDISIVRLNPGLRYVNETFGTDAEPNGIRMKGISATHPPHLRVYDALSMNNPFSGSCEGVTMAPGALIPDGGNKEYVRHVWTFFENGDEAVDGSCGSPILTDEGEVVGLFRFKAVNSNFCLAISALELQEYGYEICGGEQTFT